MQGVVVRVAEEVGRGILKYKNLRIGVEDLIRTDLSDHEGLDFSRVRDVRSDTQVDHGSATIYSCRRPVGNFGLNKIPLILIILHPHHRQSKQKSGQRASQLTWNISSNLSFETSRRSNL